MNSKTGLISFFLFIMISSCSSTHILTKDKNSKGSSIKLYCVDSIIEEKDFRNVFKDYVKFNDTVYSSKKACEESETYQNFEKSYKDSMLYFISRSSQAYSQVSCLTKKTINKLNFTILSPRPFETLNDCHQSKTFKVSFDKALSDSKVEKHTQLKVKEKTRLISIEQFVKVNPSSHKYKAAAINREILLGMPEELLILSWGTPKDINESFGAWGINKQFVYGNRRYVYINNGYVSSWQL